MVLLLGVVNSKTNFLIFLVIFRAKYVILS